MKKLLSPLWFLLSLLSIAISSGAYAMDNGALPDNINFADDDYGKTCIDLEQEMTTLVPLTYARQSGFYEDPIRGAAITVGTMIFPLAYGVVGYQEFVAFEERKSIASVEQRIEKVRRLKAEKHCFES
ncbi:MAG: hypothetical protein RPU39_17820 [Candidatus Sedimenticola sp. (ex Thyasira tokunagai)]